MNMTAAPTRVRCQASPPASDRSAFLLATRRTPNSHSRTMTHLRSRTAVGLAALALAAVSLVRSPPHQRPYSSHQGTRCSNDMHTFEFGPTGHAGTCRAEGDSQCTIKDYTTAKDLKKKLLARLAFLERTGARVQGDPSIEITSHLPDAHWLLCHFPGTGHLHEFTGARPALCFSVRSLEREFPGDEISQLRVIAHEVGHLLLGDDEAEADRYAYSVYPGP